jgi:hypothetical protein
MLAVILISVFMLVMSELVKFFSLSNPSKLCSRHFPGQLGCPDGTNEEPTVLIAGARPPPKYVFKNKMSSTKL